MDSGISFEKTDVKDKVEQLLTDETYVDSTTEFINDTGNVIGRINAAIEIFKG